MRHHRTLDRRSSRVRAHIVPAPLLGPATRCTHALSDQRRDEVPHSPRAQLSCPRSYSRVKGDPSHIVKQRQTAGDEQLAKVLDIDAHLVVPLKVEACLVEQVERLGRAHVVAAGDGQQRACSGALRAATHLTLKRKLNCQVQTSGGRLPCSSQSVMPSWMSLSRSTLQRSVW